MSPKLEDEWPGSLSLLTLLYLTGRLADWFTTTLLYLRYRVVKTYEGTCDNGDVHHVPEVPHVGSGVKNKTLVKNLKELFFFNEAIAATLAPAGRCECL